MHKYTVRDTDLREIQSYLSMHIVHNHSLRCIKIDQSGYIKDVLEHFDMSDATPHNTPLVTFLPWTDPDCVFTGYDYGPKCIISHGLLSDGVISHVR